MDANARSYRGYFQRRTSTQSPSTRSTIAVQESMLADKEEHIVYRNAKSHLPESYQFQLREPDYLYNYGEIYNLSIRRGTLTD